jgi:hypothetical protein
MAQKRKKPGDLPAPASKPDVDQAPNKAAAIRAVRDWLRSQGQEVETAVIAGILAHTRWASGDVRKDKNYISVLLSGDRTKEGGPPGKPGRRPRSHGGEPTVTELKLVRELAEEDGTLQSLCEAVDRIDEIAAQVGGYQRLKNCLEFYKEMYGRQGLPPPKDDPKPKYRSIDDE